MSSYLKKPGELLAKPAQFLASLPQRPGIYQMYDDSGILLYVGKAKNLKARVSSYFRRTSQPKVKALMEKVATVEVMVTSSETAAWLVESNLIKTKRPRYNIFFKDDKSYPYLVFSAHLYPRISVSRRSKKMKKGSNNYQEFYFGPYPDAGAVNSVLKLLQKVFKLRVCRDNFMIGRSRACLLEQLDLCTAPCVKKVTEAHYHQQVTLALEFLQAKTQKVTDRITKLMEQAALKLDYEIAAEYRNQLTSIRKVQTEQAVVKAAGNLDVVAIVANDQRFAINVLFIRNGLLLGNKSFFPKEQSVNSSSKEVLLAFIKYYYLSDLGDTLAFGNTPDQLLLNLTITERAELMKVLASRFSKGVSILSRATKANRQLITIAELNAANGLKNCFRPIEFDYSTALLELQNILQLREVPKTIEGFDISHTRGEFQVASIIVFNQHGPVKSAYRRFNLNLAGRGDDYAALSETLTKRYLHKENLPEVIIIDGGKGQIAVAIQAFNRLSIKPPKMIAIAKGKSRKPGLEKIFIDTQSTPLKLMVDGMAFRLIQQIRDEAHRFAVAHHRFKMRKSRTSIGLDQVAGIGPTKIEALLKHFGGGNELQAAGIDDLVKVKGISYCLAKSVYEHLHS